MSKIGQIIQREYISRVKKKSFIIMTILGPILMAAIFVIPVWLATMEDEDQKSIAVIDNSHNNFEAYLKSSNTLKFQFLKDVPFEDIKKNFKAFKYYAVLYNPDDVNYAADSISLYSTGQPSINVKHFIQGQIEKKIEREKLDKLGIDKNLLNSIKTHVDLRTVKWGEGGKEEKSSTEMVMAIGFIAALIIYMFIFVYGAMVMRGVIEEKTNRVVEILISSVKPFELMMGKIVGIAMVAFTQFALWVLLTSSIITTAQAILLPGGSAGPQSTTEQLANSGIPQVQPVQDNPAAKVFQAMASVNWGAVAFCFVFFFIGGYLLYSSLFASIGAAVDNETETQQFMLPVTIPLILGIVLAQGVIRNPDSALAFWLSVFPLTSPVIMMIRVPFGVPAWELILSMVVLIISFVVSTWMAGKIYRTGILMYGKKVSYRELWKWIKYR